MPDSVHPADDRRDTPITRDEFDRLQDQLARLEILGQEIQESLMTPSPSEDIPITRADFERLRSRLTFFEIILILLTALVIWVLLIVR